MNKKIIFVLAVLAMNAGKIFSVGCTIHGNTGYQMPQPLCLAAVLPNHQYYAAILHHLAAMQQETPRAIDEVPAGGVLPKQTTWHELTREGKRFEYLVEKHPVKGVDEEAIDYTVSKKEIQN